MRILHFVIMVVCLCLSACASLQSRGVTGTPLSAEEAATARREIAEALYGYPLPPWRVAAEWAESPRLQAARGEIEKLEEQGPAARAELLAARKRYAADFAKHDRSYAEDMAALRDALEHIASTSEGLNALILYNKGEQRRAVAMLDEVRAAAAPAQSHRERAAAARHIVTLMLGPPDWEPLSAQEEWDRYEDAVGEYLDSDTIVLVTFPKPEFSFGEIIARFEATTRLDSHVHRDWIVLATLHGDPAKKLRAAQKSLRIARTGRERFLSLKALGDAYEDQDDHYEGQEDQRQEDLEKALGAWREAWEILKGLAETDPNPVALGRDIHALLSSISEHEEGEERLATLKESFEVMKRLAQAEPTLHGPRSAMLSDLDEIRRILMSRKDPDGALATCRERLELLDRLAAADPDETEIVLDKAGTLIDMADIFLMRREREKARPVLRESLAILRSLDATVPGSSSVLQRKLALRLKEFGTIAAYREARDILRRVAAHVDVETDLQEILARLGEALLKQGDLDGAIAAWRERIDSIRRMARAASAPDSTRLKHRLAAELSGFADRLRKLGRLKEAMAVYRESLDVQGHLGQRDLAFGLLRFGDVFREEGQPRKALAFYRESLGIRRRLAEADPDVSFYRRDVAVCLQRIGDAWAALKDRRGALRAYREAFDIVWHMADTDPALIRPWVDLIVMYVKMAELTGDNSHIQMALKVALMLRQRDMLLPDDAWMIDDLQRRLKQEISPRKSGYELLDLP